MFGILGRLLRWSFCFLHWEGDFDGPVALYVQQLPDFSPVYPVFWIVSGLVLAAGRICAVLYRIPLGWNGLFGRRG